jgi:5-methylcytosine-specific restriction endonuclease McrA
MAVQDCICARCGASFRSKAFGYPPKQCEGCRRKRAGRVRTPRPERGPFQCERCGVEYFTRCIAGQGEKFCGRACSDQDRRTNGASMLALATMAHHNAIAREVGALRRIARRWAGGAQTHSDCQACGKRYRKNTHSSRCVACRSGKAAKSPCVACGRPVDRERKWHRTCSDACREKAAAQARALFRASDAWKKARRASKKKYKTTRRARTAIAAQAIDPIAVFRRDRWKCHLCGVKTSPDLRGTCEPEAPELDHIVSLAEGGGHTWSNVACACRRCNGNKGAASIGQLNLGWAA